TKNPKPCRVQVLRQAFHVENNTSHYVILALELKLHSRRKAGDAKCLISEPLKTKRRNTVDQNRQVPVDEPHRCFGSFSYRCERFSYDEHRHEFAGNAEVAGEAPQLGF